MRTGWILSLAVATAALAGAGAAGAAPAAAPSHIETAVPFIPSGYFHAPVYRWARTTVRSQYRSISRLGEPGSLRLTLDPALFEPIVLEPISGPRRAELERLGARVGKRLARRAREVIEEALDGLDPSGGGDAPSDDDVSTDEEGLVVESCGLAVSWAGDALWDDSLDRGNLDDLVDRAQDEGWSHAFAAGTRTAFAEAAYLGLTAADLAEGWRPVANEPGRDPGSAGSVSDALVGRGCRSALRAVGLRGVRIDSSLLTSSLSFIEPSTVYVSAPRAEADGMRCRFLPSRFQVRRCVWDSPFSD
jgi:hypothetical protein